MVAHVDLPHADARVIQRCLLAVGGGIQGVPGRSDVNNVDEVGVANVAAEVVEADVDNVGVVLVHAGPGGRLPDRAVHARPDRIHLVRRGCRRGLRDEDGVGGGVVCGGRYVRVGALVEVVHRPDEVDVHLGGGPGQSIPLDEGGLVHVRVLGVVVVPLHTRPVELVQVDAGVCHVAG